MDTWLARTEPTFAERVVGKPNHDYIVFRDQLGAKGGAI